MPAFDINRRYEESSPHYVRQHVALMRSEVTRKKAAEFCHREATALALAEGREPPVLEPFKIRRMISAEECLYKANVGSLNFETNRELMHNSSELSGSLRALLRRVGFSGIISPKRTGKFSRSRYVVLLRLCSTLTVL